MQVLEAQADIRRSFVGGGPGVLASSLVWFAAATVEAGSSVALGFTVLFFGGMTIFPLSLLVARVVFRRAGAQSGNGLTPIALESTVAMIAGLFAAYLFLDPAPGFVFPVSALVVGAHYFSFRTLYGDPVFLALGASISVLGLNSVFEWIALPGGLLWWVAGVELVFGLVLTIRSMRK